MKKSIIKILSVASIALILVSFCGCDANDMSILQSDTEDSARKAAKTNSTNVKSISSYDGNRFEVLSIEYLTYKNDQSTMDLLVLHDKIADTLYLMNEDDRGRFCPFLDKTKQVYTLSEFLAEYHDVHVSKQIDSNDDVGK